MNVWIEILGQISFEIKFQMMLCVVKKCNMHNMIKEMFSNDKLFYVNSQFNIYCRPVLKIKEEMKQKRNQITNKTENFYV